MTTEQPPGLLAGLAGAARALAGELQIDAVLETITQMAADTTGARYAALGVIDPTGRIARFVTVGVDDATIAAIGHYPEGHGLLGLLIDHPQVLRLEDLSAHPQAAGFPANHPPMTTFLGAPVVAGGKVFGNFYLTDKPGGFTADDEALVEVLAAQAGTAISNALLAERLADLAVQSERDRISRDLHDSVIQSLFSIGMGLEAVRDRVEDDPDQVRARIDAAVDGLDAAIRELRNAIFRLRPHDAAALGLTRGLAELAREFETHALVGADLEVQDGLDAAVPATAVADVLQVVREALTNAGKHARARAVRVRAQSVRGQAVVTVIDDGVGFDGHARAPVRSGHGLGNMRARAAAIGGTLTVRSAPGAGTTVRLTVPAR